MNRRRKTVSKKAMRSRGGFSVPNAAFARKVVTSAVARNALKSADPAHAVRRGMTAFDKATIAVNLGATAYRMAKETGLLGDEKNVIATSSESASMSPLVTGNMGNVYKTKFEVGDKPYSAVRLAEKVGGSRKLTVADTDIDLTTSAERATLSPATGFNQKTYTWYDNRAYWTYLDLFTLGNAAALDPQRTMNQRTYWLTKNFGIEFDIYNRNKYLPITVKIHWFKQILPNTSAKDAMNRAYVAGTLPTVASVNYGTVPYYEQLTAVAPNAAQTTFAVDPICGSLMHSAAVKDSFDRIRTFSKTLRPGEVWNFDYKHNTPSGINMQQLADKEDSGGGNVGYNENASAFYFPVFELVGPEVECHASQNLDVSYIGTAPGSILIHMRKTAELVTDSRDNVDFDSATSSGGASTPWVYKTYTDAGTSDVDTVINRRFNVDPANILKTGEATSPTKYIIPVTTEMVVKRAGYDNSPG